MKKVLLLLLMVATFMACSKDDDNSLDLEKDKIDLLSDETYTINARSDIPLTYTSDNEYVAKVTRDGVIEAQRIGQANITVSDGKNSGYILVTVKPKYNIYPDPILEFGISKSVVIEKLGTPDSETATGIMYNNYSSKAPSVMYLFDENNKLESVGVLVKSSYSSELGSFLGERYALVTYDNDSYTIFGVNDLNKNTITMGVGVSIYNLNYWFITFFPYKPTKSSVIINCPFEELIKTLE